ncbi:MAG: hypothetical protein U1E65_03455 [Myxococcota bacterium]
MSYHFADREIADPYLEVWPASGGGCLGDKRERKQNYQIRMELSITDERATGIAHVPHLQVGERFCLLVRWMQVANPVTARLQRRVESSFSGIDGAQLVGGDTYLELARKIVAGAVEDFCGFEQENSRLPRCSGVDLAAIRDILESLATPYVTAYAQLSSSLKRQALLRKERQQRTDRLSLLRLKARDPKTGQPVLDEHWLDAKGGSIEGVHSATIAVSAILSSARTSPSPGLLELKTWLLDWGKFLLGEVENNHRVRDESIAADAALETLTALAVPAIVTQLRKTLRAEKHVEPFTTSSEVGTYNNYLSPDSGIAVAIPFTGSAQVGLVPYLGINFYLQPVDRDVDFDQLLHPWCQRLSLTLGLSLANSLTLPRHDLNGVIADRYAVVGVGVRVLSFARISALLFLAEAAPKGDLSAEHKLIAAGAVALSADLDAVTFVSSRLSN